MTCEPTLLPAGRDQSVVVEVRAIITNACFICSFSNLLSTRDALNCTDTARLTGCPARVVSPSCPILPLPYLTVVGFCAVLDRTRCGQFRDGRLWAVEVTVATVASAFYSTIFRCPLKVLLALRSIRLPTGALNHRFSSSPPGSHSPRVHSARSSTAYRTQEAYGERSYPVRGRPEEGTVTRARGHGIDVVLPSRYRRARA
jgi:hypothetical protein